MIRTNQHGSPGNPAGAPTPEEKEERQMKYLKRGPIDGLWPDPLRLAANEADMPANARAWATRHNEAVTAYGLNGSLKPGERAILQIAEAIWVWAFEHGSDGFGDPNVLVPMMHAFRDALNFELGRLDGGVLDGWVCDLAEHLDIDLDGVQ